MRFFKYTFLMLGGFLLLSPMVNAAEVNLQWQEPDKFRDVEASNLTSQKQFQRNVIDELGKHIQAAADNYLPENHRLDMTVTDMDLAGDVRYFFTRYPNGIRVVKNLYFPSIEFRYELTDGTGKLIGSGEENVQDMGFQFSGVQMVKNAPLGYEKRMIDDWFRTTFSDS